MEVTLIVVTLVSIALAIAMGILTWRLLQEERLRSDARVAALEQGLAETLQDAYVTQAAASPMASTATRAATTEADSSRLASSTVASSPETPRNDLFTRDDTDWLAHFPASSLKLATVHTANSGDAVADAEETLFAGDRPHASVTTDPATDFNGTHTFKGGHAARGAVAADAAIASDDDVAADSVVNANGGLFGQISEVDDNGSGGWSRRALAIAAVAVVMIGTVLAFWTIGRLMDPTTGPDSIAARTGAGAGANGGAAAAALELMSLRQEMQDGTLTISGLVRNPRAGVPQERLTAVVFFFDGQGGFLSSTRAPLDYRALAPGEESPFQLTAPAPPGVARYRVSFRRDEGAVVPHVDRRQQVQGQQSQQEASRS